jgi:hypothetical protein
LLNKERDRSLSKNPYPSITLLDEVGPSCPASRVCAFEMNFHDDIPFFFFDTDEGLVAQNARVASNVEPRKQMSGS